MLITFSPVRRDETLSLVRTGDSLTINGTSYDFSDLAEGDALLPEALGTGWCAGPVQRREGRIHVHVCLPHGPDAPVETRHPTPVLCEDDGPVPVPPWSVAPAAMDGG